MVSPRPFLSEAAASRIKSLKRRGYATTERLQDPQVTIALMRRGDHETGGWVQVGSYALIRISLTNRDPEESAANRGAVESSTVGEFVAWAPVDCRQDDRFVWANLTCVIDQVNPARSDVVGVQFHLLEGGA